MSARILVVALALFTGALLQTALFPHASILGFRPDLLLLATTLFALRAGALAGLRVGITAGILADLLLNQSAVGLSALIFVGVGYTVGVAKPYLAAESITAPLLLSFMAGVVGTAGYGLLIGIPGETRLSGIIVLETALFVGMYNTLLAPAADALIRWINRTFPAESASVVR